MNGHCDTCSIEPQCGYEYKPCDCRDQLKFKPKQALDVSKLTINTPKARLPNPQEFGRVYYLREYKTKPGAQT